MTSELSPGTEVSSSYFSQRFKIVFRYLKIKIRKLILVLQVIDDNAKRPTDFYLLMAWSPMAGPIYSVAAPQSPGVTEPEHSPDLISSQSPETHALAMGRVQDPSGQTKA